MAFPDKIKDAAKYLADAWTSEAIGQLLTVVDVTAGGDQTIQAVPVSGVLKRDEFECPPLPILLELDDLELIKVTEGVTGKGGRKWDILLTNRLLRATENEPSQVETSTRSGHKNSRIFISYSSKSKTLVTTLVEDLETANYQVWFDHKLTGGQIWWEQILEKIRQCDLFIFALTPEALESYPCQLEYKYAYQLNKNILPVLMIDGVSPNLLPPELSRIQFIDYRIRDTQTAIKLMQALNNLPHPHSLPDPLPEPPPVPISYLGSIKEQIESPQTLSFEAQAALLFRLKEHLLQDDNPEDVLSLLRRMKRRDDLLAKIEKEIDAILTNKTIAPPVRRLKQIFDPVPISKPQSKSQLRHSSYYTEYHQVEPVEQYAREISKRSLLIIVALIVSSALVWAVWGFLNTEIAVAYDLRIYHEFYSNLASSLGMGLRDYYNIYNGLNLLISIAALATHGIATGLILHQIKSPKPLLTVGWYVRSALMGGPFSILLLRRIGLSTHQWKTILLIICVVCLYSISLLWLGMNGRLWPHDPPYDWYGDRQPDPALIGAGIGVLGALVKSGLLIWLRHSK